jgi:predicted ATPase
MTDTTDLPGLRLSVRNFRGVRDASWAPEGVCALVGPNASGKSTLLEAFLFAHYAAKRSPKDAILVSGGMQAFMHHRPLLDAPGASGLARVLFKVETPRASWTLSFFVGAGDNAAQIYDESLRAEGAPDTEQQAVGISRSTVFENIRRGAPEALERDRELVLLRDRLDGLSLYRPWELQAFRKQPWSDPSLDDTALTPDGANLFVVLQNWRDARSEQWRFDWVMEQMRTIHPRRFETLEFRKGGGVLSAQFYTPGDETPLPIKSASDGLLGTLLTLSAVAGARSGGIVLLDEPDNGLHPFAIRSLVEAFRALHEARGTHVVLATHSPAILNAFSASPDDVWVTEEVEGHTFPTRLTELRDPEWLANFRLGNLYGTGFGRQDPLSGSEG